MSQRSIFGLSPPSCWGLSRDFDIGAVECTFHPVRFDEQCDVNAPFASKDKELQVVGPAPAHALPILADPFGCAGPESAMCCVAEGAEGQTGMELFAPCMVCATRAACIVEIPCGHATVCVECYGDYQTNARCLRCRDQVSARVDVGPFLDELTGRPGDCNMCKNALASVVTIPCVHMCFCASCLPESPAGCPTCGARVERTCQVKWLNAASLAPSERAMRYFPSLPASVGALPAHGRDGLAEVTQDVEHEISRLEQQLRRLRTQSQSSGSAAPMGNAPPQVFSPQDGRHPDERHLPPMPPTGMQASGPALMPPGCPGAFGGPAWSTSPPPAGGGGFALQ